MAPPKTFTQEELNEAVTQALAKAPRSGVTKEDLADILKTVIPATIMAMDQAKTQSTHEQTLKAIKAKLALTEKCSICRQVVGDGKGRGCGGPWARDTNGAFILQADGKTRIEKPEQFHVKAVIYPTDPIALRQWDGIQINGAYYRSNGPNHEIWVPKVNDIAQMLLKYEEDQRIQQIGRKFARQSGSLSGTGGRSIQAPTFQ